MVELIQEEIIHFNQTLHQQRSRKGSFKSALHWPTFPPIEVLKTWKGRE